MWCKRERQKREGKHPETHKKNEGKRPKTQHRPPRRSRTKNRYNHPSKGNPKTSKEETQKHPKEENPKTRDNPWSLTKTRTPPMRKTQKLEDERWLWTTARTNKQANLIFHDFCHMFSDSHRVKKIFSSKIEKNIFWTKNKTKFGSPVFFKNVHILLFFLRRRKGGAKSDQKTHLCGKKWLRGPHKNRTKKS